MEYYTEDFIRRKKVNLSYFHCPVEITNVTHFSHRIAWCRHTGIFKLSSTTLAIISLQLLLLFGNLFLDLSAHLIHSLLLLLSLYFAESPFNYVKARAQEWHLLFTRSEVLMFVTVIPALGG